MQGRSWARPGLSFSVVSVGCTSLCTETPPETTRMEAALTRFSDGRCRVFVRAISTPATASRRPPRPAVVFFLFSPSSTASCSRPLPHGGKSKFMITQQKTMQGLGSRKIPHPRPASSTAPHTGWRQRPETARARKVTARTVAGVGGETAYQLQLPPPPLVTACSPRRDEQNHGQDMAKLQLEVACVGEVRQCVRVGWTGPIAAWAAGKPGFADTNAWVASSVSWAPCPCPFVAAGPLGSGSGTRPAVHSTICLPAKAVGPRVTLTQVECASCENAVPEKATL